MKLKGVNKSSIKTINLIKKTFAELMEEKKEISSITVTELVKRADITRGTFYSHYDNIYDIANEFQEEILEKVLNKRIDISTKEDLRLYLSNIFQYIDDNKVIYSKLLKSNEAILFMRRFEKKVCNALVKVLPNKKNKDLNVSFFTIGTITLLIKYFRGEVSENFLDIKNYSIKLAEYILFES